MKSNCKTHSQVQGKRGKSYQEIREIDKFLRRGTTFTAEQLFDYSLYNEMELIFSIKSQL
jgi:hypothetical protein